MSPLEKIKFMLRETQADREWFHGRAQNPNGFGRQGARIDTAACAVREKALQDAIAAFSGETS